MTLFVRHYEVQNLDVSLGHFFGRLIQVREISPVDGDNTPLISGVNRQ